MTPEQFCYWLQGFLELGADDVKRLDEKRVQMVRDHLKTVFAKITPDYEVIEPKPEPLSKKLKKKVLNEEREKTPGERFHEVLEELRKDRDERVTCNPFDPYPGRIC